MNQERLLSIIIAPHVSEKSTICAELNNQVVFKVLKNASKKEISAAVNLLFEVDPLAVRVLNVKGKSKRSGKYLGKRGNWKKAYVTLPEGKDLDFGQS
ncbi:MAG: 50S ribosomal protein L23 [Methylococcales bacterium]|jgi:large subunit ribosomal protein L23|nr:50S ribosomal protein L23 [Methylococcales bacterium]MBT7445609.1 50S ribosomal protein L23 [Methylococcales bacterium]